jgi:ABC-type multidrug transport system fused ATPase/permease subunit
MAFEELKESTEGIQEQVKAIIESNVAYYKLRTFKIAMKSTAMIVKVTMVALCFLMVLLFLSIALAFWLGNYYSNYGIGFLCVGGIYVIITLLLLLGKDRFIEGAVLKKFSELFFND